MKYYIMKTDDRFSGRYAVQYKRYKCADGFTDRKDLCWKFSKQGALKIIERLKEEYRRVLDHVTFTLVAAE